MVLMRWPVGCQLLHPRDAGVHNVDTALGVDSQPGWHPRRVGVVATQQDLPLARFGPGAGRQHETDEEQGEEQTGHRPGASWRSFMYSYPNLIPLPAASVRRIADSVRPFAFERIYGAWDGRQVSSGGKDAVDRSAERYIRFLERLP